MVRREITLARGQGRVNVRANVVAADVYLDGRLVGTSPWRGQAIESGPHSLRVEKPGHDPFTLDFVLEHEEEEQIAAELRERPGGLVVTCAQDEITVFMDEASRGPVGRCSTGRTLTLSDVPAGPHKLWGVRGSERSDVVTVIVRGGETVPAILSLRLGLPPEVREAEQRRKREAEEYEPFGGHRWTGGLYVAAGYVGSRGEWDLSFPDTALLYNADGHGIHLGVSMFRDPWRFDLGVDRLFLGDSGDLEGNSYYEMYLGATCYFIQRSPLRPFLGLRGHMNRTSLDWEGHMSDFTNELAATGWGVSGQAGAALRLGDFGFLELAASYSWTGRRDLEGEVEYDSTWGWGEIESSGIFSVQAGLSFHVGPKR
jgi:hypothetical protein